MIISLKRKQAIKIIKKKNTLNLRVAKLKDRNKYREDKAFY